MKLLYPKPENYFKSPVDIKGWMAQFAIMINIVSFNDVQSRLGFWKQGMWLLMCSLTSICISIGNKPTFRWDFPGRIVRCTNTKWIKLETVERNNMDMTWPMLALNKSLKEIRCKFSICSWFRLWIWSSPNRSIIEPRNCCGHSDQWEALPILSKNTGYMWVALFLSHLDLSWNKNAIMKHAGLPV